MLVVFLHAACADWAECGGGAGVLGIWDSEFRTTRVSAKGGGGRFRGYFVGVDGHVA